MFRIRSADEVISPLPDLVPAAAVAVESIDLLVIALGSEDRTLSGLEHLLACDLKIARALVWEYSTQPELNSAHRETATRLLAAARVEITFENNLDQLRQNLLAALPNQGTRQLTVAIDLSVMSGKVILGWMDALGAAADHLQIRLIALYSEAMDYAPSEFEYCARPDAIRSVGSFGLDEGVLNVGAATNFEGGHDPQLKEQVIVVPGFSVDRTRASISYINPALLLSADGSLTWIIGSPPAGPNRWRRDAMLDMYSLSADAATVVESSTFQFKDVCRYLIERYEADWLTANMNIVFLGSKLQGLGVGLFAISHRSARVVLAVPEAYKLDNYTSGVRQLWAADFTDWTATVRSLASVGSISVDD